MNNVRRALVIFGSECQPSSINCHASTTPLRRCLLQLVPLALAVVAFGAAGAPAQAQRSQKATEPEPGNILPANHDAVFDATIAKRKSLLDRITPVTGEMLEHPADGDWLTWRRSYSSLGYSPLRQIDAANVHSVREAWAWVLPVSSDEITPLVHDGIIFIKSANTVQALDGKTGDLLWQYVRSLPASLHNGSSSIVRNLAIYQDMLYAPTVDGHIVALNVKTGALVWDQQVLGPLEIADHLRLDGGPIVAKGKVIMGVSGCNTYPGGCFIFGLDARTGAEAWQFHTIARPGQPGGDSWNGAPVEQRFGGSVWTSGSYDPNLNLVYFGTGQTYDTGTLLEPHAQKGKSNDGLYTDSTVALDPDTGKLVWYYQHMNRDVWDLDWAFEQSLLTLPVRGKPTDLLVTGGKLMIFDAVNRASGKYEFSKDLGLQTLVSAIDPITGKKIINPALEPEANVTKHFCPHSGGGRNWPATSYDPESKILYVPLYESCQDFTWIPRDPAKTAVGGSDMHFVLHTRPDSDGKIGRLEAVNLETRKVAWIYRQRAAMSSSTLTTAGGLVFAGSRDRRFRAFDASTGQVLWQRTLGASLSSTPVAYSIDGQEYVAVVAGNGGPVAWPQLTPEIANPLGGTTLWVFKLPDTPDSAQP
jgi:PQQ-dependent dehydrogenase (methanol/ethanol family)